MVVLFSCDVGRGQASRVSGGEQDDQHHADSQQGRPPRVLEALFRSRPLCPERIPDAPRDRGLPIEGVVAGGPAVPGRPRFTCPRCTTRERAASSCPVCCRSRRGGVPARRAGTRESSPCCIDATHAVSGVRVGVNVRVMALGEPPVRRGDLAAACAARHAQHGMRVIDVRLHWSGRCVHDALSAFPAVLATVSVAYVGPRPVASHHAMVEFEGGIRRYQAAWSSRACLVECSWGPSPMSCDARLRVTTEDAQRARTTIRFTQPSR